MQRLAQEQNEKIEAVNRERKYHQVIYIFNVLSFDVIHYYAVSDQ